MTELTLDQVDWLSRYSGKPIDITMNNGQGFAKPDPSAAVKPPEDATARLDKLFRMRRIGEIGNEQSTKELLIDTATASLEGRKDEIRKAFTKKIKGRDGKEHDLIDKKGEQKKSYDAHNDGIEQAAPRKGPDQAPPATIERNKADPGGFGKDTTVNDMGKMMELIVAEQKKLEAAKVDRTTKGEWDPAHPTDESKIVWTVQSEPLFTAKEIMNEIYTPLVRELVIPETIVPDKYSQTQQMVDGSNEAYIQECREKGTNTDMGVSDLLDAGKTLVSGLGNAASAFELANGASSATIALTNMAISAANFMLDVGSTVASGILLDQTSFTAMATDIAGLVGGALTAQFGGSSDPAIKALPGLVSGMIGAGAGGFGGAAMAATKYLKDQKGDEFADGLGTALANFLAGAINGAMAEVTKRTDLAEDKQAAALVSAFTGFAASEITSIAKNAVAARKAHLIDAYNAGQRSKFATLLNGVVTDVAKNMVSVGTAIDTAKVDADLTNDKVSTADQQPVNDVIALQKQYGGLATGDLSAGAKAAIQWLESNEKDVLDYKKKKDEEIKDFSKKLEADLDKHRKALDSLDTDPADFPDFKTMAAMIKQAETDKIKWQTLMAFASMSSSVLTAVMPALNAAGELITFAMESALLLKRTEAAYIWYQSKKDAVNAVSPYASSLADLYGNQAEQALQHGFMAGQHLVKAMLNFAAHFDPTGSCVAASLAVGVVSATEEAVYKLYKRKALSDAWKQTEVALNNPKNRKAALIAREMNPTLAKYTIAYGALVEGDAMATRALNQIGLDTETLNNANGKIKDVAKFLKELYWEDNVVLDSRAPGAAGKAAKLKPPATTLTLDGWATSLAFWRQHAKLSKTDPAPLIGKLLGKVEEFASKTDADVTVAEYDVILTILGKLLAAFKSFPVKIEPDDSPIALSSQDVSDGVKLYADKTDAQITLAKLAKTRREDEDALAAQAKAATASSGASDDDDDGDDAASQSDADDAGSDISQEADATETSRSSTRAREKVSA